MFSWIRSWFFDWKQKIGHRLESRDRSAEWPRVREAHLRKNPHCIACGQLAETVHHAIPVSRSPELELEAANLYSYCDRHHFLIGHLGDYRSYNPEQDQAAAINLALVSAYRKTTRLSATLVPRGHVIYTAAFDLIDRQYGKTMSPPVLTAFETLRKFIEEQRP